MDERSEVGEGFSVLDGGAIVTGAAVASIHLRAVFGDDLAAPGGPLLWGIFAWVGLTSAGPFLFLVRRFLRRLADYPRVGDVLWAVLGLPWILTAAILASGAGTPSRSDALYSTGLTIGLA